MDDIDLNILEILKKNSRTKYVDIAEMVGLTEGAIRKRVKNLVRTNVITRFTIETSIDFEGIVLVETYPTNTGITKTQIENISSRIFEVSGDYDIAVFIEASSINDLNSKIDEIRNLRGVQRTNTLVKLKD